jgi:hypothetical protein
MVRKTRAFSLIELAICSLFHILFSTFIPEKYISNKTQRKDQNVTILVTKMPLGESRETYWIADVANLNEYFALILKQTATSSSNFSFLAFGRIPWTGNLSIARPLPTLDSKNRITKHELTSITGRIRTHHLDVRESNKHLRPHGRSVV